MLLTNIIENIEFQENSDTCSRLSNYYKVKHFVESFISNFRFEKQEYKFQNEVLDIILKNARDSCNTMLEELDKYIIMNLDNYAKNKKS